MTANGESAPVELRVEHVRKAYAGSVAVGDISFTVQPGQLFTLLGPSGCGKTTTLRSIAGLELPDRGMISVGERRLFDHDRGIDLPSERRGLGMVFQSYAIWPHMTVFKNVAFPFRVGSRRTRPSRQEAHRRVEQALATVGLDHLADRLATALSGGQQQRLALARALVMEPSVLLLDEPLSNLDAKLRESMRLELKRLQNESGITSIYVTHDQAEALAMSDVIAVMNEGAIEQVGTPDDIYYRPASRFVAEFIGSTNLLKGSASETRGEHTVVQTEAGPVTSLDRLPTGPRCTPLLSIRPEDVTLSSAEKAVGDNSWRGQVSARAFLGESTSYVVESGDVTWQCKVAGMARFAIGDSVNVSVPAERVRIVPDVN